MTVLLDKTFSISENVIFEALQISIVLADICKTVWLPTDVSLAKIMDISVKP